MKANSKFLQLIERIQEGYVMTREECEFLLGFDEKSLEAGITRSIADSLSRELFNNKGLVFGQIGVEIAPCPGKCKFCSFSEDFTSFQSFSIDDEALYNAADNFTASGELFALALMVMHHTPFERTLDVIRKVRARIPAKTQIVANLGDFSRTQAEELKAAGANGAYHVWRLGEGSDTQFPASQRLATIENIKAAGLDLYYCCEPIGPEHTPAQMAEIIMKAIHPEPEQRWLDPKDLGKAIAAYMQRNSVNDVPITAFTAVDIPSEETAIDEINIEESVEEEISGEVVIDAPIETAFEDNEEQITIEETTPTFEDEITETNDSDSLNTSFKDEIEQISTEEIETDDSTEIDADIPTVSDIVENANKPVEENTVVESSFETTVAPISTPSVPTGSSGSGTDLRSEIKSVLLYMDQLLENLPEEKIMEFAKSEEFTTYKKLFSELGLS
jgi:hypothetical protein